NLVVVMGRAHEATIRRVVDAGRDFGVKVMGDNLASADRVACARWMEDLGVDFIVHHIGYDERRMIAGVSPLDELDTVVRAVSIRQAIECPARGAPLVVIGAPLVIDADEFKPAAAAGLREVLMEICREIRKTQRSSLKSQVSRLRANVER